MIVSSCYVGECSFDILPYSNTPIVLFTPEVVKEEDVYDFLREIELMKDIGKHENVIQMYGCCTKCRPICLVLEYASGGNLLNYLRSLKKKVAK
jgi:serine/threonine protein kinase